MKTKMWLLIVLVCFLVADLNVNPVFAGVPTVTSVAFWTRQSDGHTILNITVVHTGYILEHFVDWVRVNVSSTVQTMDLTDSSPVDQTISSAFVVQYDMGIVADAPTVQTQANCNIHGPSSWSPVMTVPELSSIQLCVALITLTIIALLFRSRPFLQLRNRLSSVQEGQ